MRNDYLQCGLFKSSGASASLTRKHFLRSAILLALLAANSPVWAKGSVTEVVTSSQPATPLTYTANGRTYSWGQGEDLYIESFSFLGNSYDFKSLADRIVIRRSDILGVAEGNPCGLFAETTGVSRSLKATYPDDGTGTGNCDLASVMGGRIINRGALDIFSNVGPTRKNIERVDFIFKEGLIAPILPSVLEQTGHIATEKTGNNPVQIAAILAVDLLGNPTKYGPLVRVNPVGCFGEEICYGQTNVEDQNDFMANNPLPPHGYVTYTGSLKEIFAVAFVSLQDLAVPAGSRYYGFSYFPDDVIPGVHNLVDFTSFPKNTEDFSQGDGADLYGGTAGYFVLETVRSVAGTAFLDENRNGIFDAAEQGVGGVSVRLYADSDKNGAFDPAIDLALGETAVTAADGAYFYNGLTNGPYFVVVDRLDPQLPPGVTLAEAASPRLFNIDENNAEGIDFAFQPPVVIVPTAQDDFAKTVQNRPVDIDVLANDQDPRGGGLALTVAVGPEQGTAVVVDGLIRYQPRPGYVGNDNFIYEVTDVGGATNRATVQVTVDPDSGAFGEIDLDKDKDGILDTLEGEGDADGDGIPNYLDLDSDNDGIHDLEESGIPDDIQKLIDSDNDGKIDPGVELGNNGFADILETFPDSGIPKYLPTDVDNDGVPDFLDLDTDSDGASDLIEGGLKAEVFDKDLDGVIDPAIFRDVNKDGYDDRAQEIQMKQQLPDTNVNGVPDYREFNTGRPITGLQGQGLGAALWLPLLMPLLALVRRRRSAVR